LKSVTVNTKAKSYKVHIGYDIFETLHGYFDKLKLSKRVFVVIDKNVNRIYGSSIKKVINAFADKKTYLVLDASEKIKSFDASKQIYDKLISENFGRDTVLIAMGGGSIGDLAGFVASTFMRGIPLINIPTTLLSAVDSSIGGKTGINYRDAKNIVGTFYQPELVLIDTKFLKSLPEEELISGFGEVIKYSYLTDKKFYSTLLSKHGMLLKKDQDFLTKIIFESVKIKSAIVSSDEKEETGLRKILNFGHTFAHAFESSSSFKLSHGRAVISGIVSALILSYEKKLIDKNQFNSMLELPMKFRSSIGLNKITPEAVFTRMLYDKKNRRGKIQFILLKNLGEILVDVPIDKKSIIKSLKKTERIWFKRATAGL